MIPFMKVGSANILENYLYIGLVLIALCTSGLTHVMDKSNKLEFVYALCLLTANIEKMICVA